MGPSGGPMDKEPPRIKAQNVSDSALHFKGGNIVIEFDEYIKLQDVQKNFHITPLTKSNPIVRVKKKTLIIELPDSLLRSETTYHLNFNNAFKDLREGNLYKNLDLIFSTGAYFDSLQLSGTLYNAENGILDTGFLMMLYDAELADSLLLKQRPSYVTEVRNGQFLFSSLPNKAFKVVGLLDANANYLYDAMDEKVAFYPDIQRPILQKEPMIMYSFMENDKRDSVKNVVKRRGNNTTKVDSLTMLNLNRFGKDQLFDINDTLLFSFSDSLAQVDVRKFRFYEGEALDLMASPKWDTLKNTISVIPDWKYNTKYTLVFADGFAKDKAGHSTQNDTLSFTTMKEKDYGTAIVVVDSQLLKNENILTLWRGNQKVCSTLLKDSTARFERLTPGNYSLQLLYDDNKNGLWDSGDFYKRILPEISIQLPQQIVIKANWENKIEWKKGVAQGKRQGNIPTSGKE